MTKLNKKLAVIFASTALCLTGCTLIGQDLPEETEIKNKNSIRIVDANSDAAERMRAQIRSIGQR